MSAANPSAKHINRLIQTFLEAEVSGLAELAVVDVSFVDPGEMQCLNQKHRRIETPTDVLSFPIYTYQDLETLKNKDWVGTEEPILLGSLVLCREIIEKNAAEEGVTLDERIEWSIKHGVKHLLGYDHNPDGSEWLPTN